MTGLEQLLAKEEIKDLMYKRIRYLDTKQWDLYAPAHTEENLHGRGHYHEKYRKEEGKWLTYYRGLSRLHLDTTPGFWDRAKK